MKRMKRWVSLLLLLTVLVSLLSACGGKTKGKNLIYIIGDGMGFNHIENAKLYMGVDKLSFEDYYVGDVTTYSASDSITDSAAAATALATGTKTNNETVGIDADGNDLQNIMELSKENGRKTGIVTTDAVHGATPAAFSAHTDRRTDKFGIMKDQAQGAVDLLVGKYDSSCMSYKKTFTDNGYQYTETFEELQTLSKDGKIVGNLNNVDSPYNPNLTDAVSLKSLVEYALDYLTANNDNAFTLMVEGAYVDKHSANKDLMQMIYAMMDLNDAVEYVFEWASGRDDTVVIFTADHETGGLAKAETKDDLRNGLYTTSEHTAANVPLYLYGATTPVVNLDNTDIYEIAKAAILNKDE